MTAKNNTLLFGFVLLIFSFSAVEASSVSDEERRRLAQIVTQLAAVNAEIENIETMVKNSGVKMRRPLQYSIVRKELSTVKGGLEDYVNRSRRDIHLMEKINGEYYGESRTNTGF